MLNSIHSAFQSNLKLPMRFICMTWPFQNIFFKVLDGDSLSWKFTALAIKSKRHKWSSKSLPYDWVQNAVLAIKWYWLFCSLCFSKWLMFLIFWSCRNKQQGMKPFGSLRSILETHLHVLHVQIQHRCQQRLETPDEKNLKTAMTTCILYFTRLIL